MKTKYQETLQGTEKEFLEVFNKLCSSRNAWQVWEDLMSAIACSLSNSVDKVSQHYEQREKEYAQCIDRLGSVELPAKILGIIVMALENNPEQDFLGAMYMQLNLGNHWKGQFFTPYCVCKMMSEITCGDIDRQIEKQGYISVCDPACGAGATLIAAANTMKNCKHNFQNHVLFVGQDIDRVVGMMCYIQLSLLGCAGYICIGNTLTNPLSGHALFPQEKEGQELWYMPMFQTDIWRTRRLLVVMKNKAATTRKTIQKKHYYMFIDFKKERAMEIDGFNGNQVSEENKDTLQFNKAADEESAKTDAVIQTEDIKSVKERAKEKLEKELQSAKNKHFAEPIMNYLLKRCKEDEGLAQDVVQEHKTWHNCFDYVYNRARKQSKENYAWICDDTVYEWAEDYYHKDDKAEEEKNAKENKEKKETKVKKEKAKTEQKVMTPKLQNREITLFKNTQEKIKPKKNSKDIEGQLDIFSLMGM